MKRSLTLGEFLLLLFPLCDAEPSENYNDVYNDFYLQVLHLLQESYCWQRLENHEMSPKNLQTWFGSFAVLGILRSTLLV